MLQLSLAITAWKRSGRQQWAVRANPSSGNLHPVEGYVIATGFPKLGDGLYHYNPLDHSLELRAEFLVQASRPSLLVGLSTLHWRETWKYGSRAFRYCALDTGHAAGAIAYAASVLGWSASRRFVPTDALDSLLGLDRMENDALPEEREHSELLLEIDLRAKEAVPEGDRVKAVFDFTVARWHGVASPIAPGAVRPWPMVADALRHSAFTDLDPAGLEISTPDLKTLDQRRERNVPPVDIILRRRSAQRFDPNGPMLPNATLQRILRATIPGVRSPWEAIVAKSRVHFAVFVQRVEGLQAGIYLLPRSGGFEYPGALAPGRPLAESDPKWPGDLPLRILATIEANQLNQLTRELFCRQDLAGESSVALAMVGEFDAALAQDGGNGYRSLHHEAGILGQVLYLESGAAGLQGTGVGCFFDDAVHHALGISDTRLQTIYHFCIGNPVADNRIKTGVPYPHRPSVKRGA
jgi:SagB-type dehydrogenase family enzyme